PRWGRATQANAIPYGGKRALFARGVAVAGLGRVALLHRLEAAHAALDGAQLDDLRLLRRGAQLVELARRDEHAALERAHRAVVGLGGRVELVAQVRHVLRHVAQALVQLLAELAHLAHVLDDAFLAPAVSGRLEQGHQRRGRGD